MPDKVLLFGVTLKSTSSIQELDHKVCIRLQTPAPGLPRVLQTKEGRF